MSPGIAAAAQTAVDTYLELLEAALPGGYQGVYLTGSAALGDWRSDRSDLDLLVVTSRPLTEADVDALADLHAKADQRPYLDAVYLGRDEIGARPASGAAGLPHAMNGEFNRACYLTDPVLWATLDRHGVTIMGRPAAELGAAPDPAWLRDWNLGNLHSYWRPWAAHTRVGLADRDPQAPLNAEIVSFALLGPGRLHYTIATGEILSKTGSADYTAEHFPSHGELLGRAKGWRLGDESVQFAKHDGLATCDLVDAVIGAAERLAAG